MADWNKRVFILPDPCVASVIRAKKDIQDLGVLRLGDHLRLSSVLNITMGSL
jgi:hypothetical protein